MEISFCELKILRKFAHFCQFLNFLLLLLCFKLYFFIYRDFEHLCKWLTLSHIQQMTLKTSEEQYINTTTDDRQFKFTIRVENIVTNIDIAHYEQFVLWPQRFQK